MSSFLSPTRSLAHDWCSIITCWVKESEDSRSIRKSWCSNLPLGSVLMGQWPSVSYQQWGWGREKKGMELLMLHFCKVPGTVSQDCICHPLIPSELGIFSIPHTSPHTHICTHTATPPRACTASVLSDTVIYGTLNHFPSLSEELRTWLLIYILEELRVGTDDQSNPLKSWGLNCARLKNGHSYFQLFP